WADESPKCVVRRAVGGNRAAAACSTSLVREAQAGSPAGGRGDRLPLPVRDRLAGPPGRLRALADGVEAPPRLVWRRNLGPHPRRAPGPRRRERGAGLVGRSRLHDLPRPPARHEPRTHHRGRRGTTRISATSLVTRACQMVCVSRTERNGTIMTMTNEKQQHDDGPSGQDLVEQLKASGQLDALFEQIDAGQVELTGDGGFVPALVKAALERGLQAELTSHLGYEKGSGEASKHANSRNGSTPKTVQAEFGPVELEIPRDRAGSFTPRLVPKGQRRLGGLDDMIISLYAGGMTIRDIQHHLATTFGTDLSHETISNITDAVLEEVAAWQSRPLEEFYPVLYLDAVRVKIRENNQVINRAAYIAIGVDLDGIKHVLGIWVQDTEGSA